MTSSGLRERLRQYEISERLSRDGKLRTYLALDTHSQRSVTLKTIHTDPEDRDVAAIIAQFRSQAQVTANLKHPGILEVYEQGEDAGIAFLAMEFIQGCFLKSGLHMPVADAGSAILQLLEALDYAHRLQVVHLDIQPACLLLTTKGRLRITDFGTSDSKPHVPMYASPERLAGEPADGRSDIFSAGACFYEWLTGTAPFGNSPEVVADRMSRERQRPPSQLDSKVPAALDSVCAKALAMKPADRYPTAQEFADELRRVFVSTFGAAPKDVLTNETVVSIFLSTLRGDSRKSASHPPIAKAESSAAAEPEPKAKSAWADQTLKAIEYQLAPFIGPVAGVVVRNASLRAKTLEALYRLAAESLGTAQEKQAFLAGRVPASAGTPLPNASSDRPKPAQPKIDQRGLESIPEKVAGVARPPEAQRQPSKPQSKAPSPVPQPVPAASRPQDVFPGQPETLAHYLGNDSAEVDDVIAGFISATEALAAFYTANGKSGGLTPESICFDKTGKATIRPSTSTSPQGATCFGSLGSPQYAAPEIFSETDAGPNSSLALSDIYALGFMFYEILLGRKLFRQTFAAQRTDLDWLRWNTDLKSKAPALRTLLPARSAALSDLLQEMMAKEVAQRTSDFPQILTRLRSIAQQSNRTMIGRSPLKPPASKQAPSKAPDNKALKVVLILIVLGLVGVLIWQGPNLYHWLSPMLSRATDALTSR